MGENKGGMPIVRNAHYSTARHMHYSIARHAGWLCYSRKWYLVMLTTIPYFVEFHILGIGHLWQHHWMMIWLRSAIGAVGCESPQDKGDTYFSFSYGWALVPWLGHWWFCCRDGLWVEDFGCHSWLQVGFWKVSQSDSCLHLEEGWYFEKDNVCFQRCRCYGQMLLGIHTSCAGVLFYSLDVGCHFQPVVAW